MNKGTEIIKIGKYSTPSQIVEQGETTGLHIKISYGGGMGGANRDIYAKDITITPDTLIKHTMGENDICVNTIEDEELVINRRFIVTQRAVRIVETRTESENYYTNRIYAFPLEQKYEFVNDYISHTVNPKPVYEITKEIR